MDGGGGVAIREGRVDFAEREDADRRYDGAHDVRVAYAAKSVKLEKRREALVGPGRGEAALMEQLRRELLSPRPTQTPAQTDEGQARGWGLPSWGIGGWLLRLVVVYVVLRRRRLAMLIWRAFGPRAPLRVS